MLHVVTTEPTALVEINLSDLSPEIQSALTALSDIEARYASDRESLEGWNGPEAARERLLNLLEARHRREREPLVQHLAELHQRLTMASMFRTLHRVH
jgi:phosphodiesterase/alkaline phosphatase D-like protein